MKLKTFLYSMLFAFFMASCHKNNQVPVIPTTSGVYICNEGNFNFGSAEISFYGPEKMEVNNNLFNAANHYSLGDVAQSFFIHDSLGFIVVNNSQKIEVVKIPSFQKVRTINIPSSSPRYLFVLNDSIAYVTELYAAKIYVVNYQNGSVIKEITQVSRWTEHILQQGNDLLVEERNLDAFPASTSGFVKVNLANHTITQRYAFNSSNINGMVKDKNSRVWILLEEDTAHMISSSLLCLNPDLSLNRTISFPVGHRPSLLRINGTGEELYYLDEDWCHLSISDNSLSNLSFISKNSRNIYAADIDPVSGDIYLSDALDFVQPSRIYRYDKYGALIHSFTAGMITGNFTFRNE